MLSPLRPTQRHPAGLLAAPAAAHARGQGLLEFALIVPLLLLFLFGVIEVGRMLAIYSSLSSAAKQAARYGSVAGDSDALVPEEQPFYLDCAGMRATALRASILVGLTEDDIDIAYDRGSTAEPIGGCALGAPAPVLSETVKDGYRVIISISATYQPLVPIVPVPELPITFAAARTIFTTIVGPTNTPLPNPDLRITKRGSPPVVSPNGELTYWITATNFLTSGVIVHNPVITDTLPLSVTLTTGDLDDIADDYNWNCVFTVQSPPPQQIRCTRLAPLAIGQSAGFSYAVQAPLFGGVILTNTVQVMGDELDLNPSDNFTYTVNPVLPGADLMANKLVSPTTPIGGGTLLTYTLWVHNNGGDLSDTKASSGDYIWMTDTLPIGATLGPITAGSGWTCTRLFGPDRLACRYQNDLVRDTSSSVVTVVMTAPTTAGTLTNLLDVTPSRLTPDPLPHNNSISVTSQIVTDADVAITKLGVTNANAGGNLLYTLRVNNLGPSVAANVRLTDVVPGTITNVTPGAGWVCENPVQANTLKCLRAAPLGVGQTAPDITVAIVVPDASISNTAIVASDMFDPNPANNSATVATTVRVCQAGRVSDTYSTVTASPSEVQADGSAVAHVTVTLRDLCDEPVLTAQAVTLNASPGGLDVLTPGATVNTSTGQAVFEVRSTNAGTRTYSASATNTATAEVVNLSATANVTFYGCVTVRGQNNQITTQTYVDYRLTNQTGRSWRLTNLTIDWPRSGNRRLNSVVMNINPVTTLWSGNANNDPFSLPGSAAFDGGADAARLLADGVIAPLHFNFSFTTRGETFILTTTWDDGNGHTCTTSAQEGTLVP